MQSEAVKDMPETIELGYFYIGAPMSEYFYSVMDDETRLQGIQPLRKAVYVRQEAAQSPASEVKELLKVIELADKFFNQPAGFKSYMAYDREAYDEFMERHRKMQEEVQKAVTEALEAHRAAVKDKA